MIAYLEGRLVERGPSRVVAVVGGVGYEIFISTGTAAALPPPGGTARLFTRLQVRDDALVLYGFATADERAIFDHLLTVTGVGPKMALAVLSVHSPDAVRRAVATGDGGALTLVSGVGKKVASRMILELRDRLGGAGEEVGGPLTEVREALLALGLSPQEARDAVAAIPVDGDRPVEELLRQALQAVGR
jgi:Holliday junction DNA helicase RuvA